MPCSFKLPEGMSLQNLQGPGSAKIARPDVKSRYWTPKVDNSFAIQIQAARRHGAAEPAMPGGGGQQPSPDLDLQVLDHRL